MENASTFLMGSLMGHPCTALHGPALDLHLFTPARPCDGEHTSTIIHIVSSGVKQNHHFTPWCSQLVFLLFQKAVRAVSSLLIPALTPPISAL